jgi:hypothetical protein
VTTDAISSRLIEGRAPSGIARLAAWYLARWASVSVIQPATIAGSPPASKVARYWVSSRSPPGRVFGQCRDIASGAVPGPALRRACDRMLPGAVWEGVSRAFVACR